MQTPSCRALSFSALVVVAALCVAQPAAGVVRLAQTPALAPGRVVVIVELADSPQTGSRRAHGPDAAQRAAQASAWRAISAHVPDADNLGGFQYALNALVVSVPAGRQSELLKVPGVKRVSVSVAHAPDLYRSPEYIGAPVAWSALGGVAFAADNVVIGLIDTGLYAPGPALAASPHPMFADPPDDAGLGGVAYGLPFTSAGGAQFTHPLGVCDPASGLSSDNTFGCSGKVIGGYWFDFTGLRAVDEVSSPLDQDGHGTHVASIAAGNRIVTTEIPGVLAPIVLSGVAPRARIISYKVCWLHNHQSVGSLCDDVDMIAAIDQAIADRVDVLNLSISGGVDSASAVARALLAARRSGIFVSASAGNAGPAGPVNNVAPWLATVAASVDDLTLGSASPSACDGDRIANYSSGGPLGDNLLKPDVAAPGGAGPGQACDPVVGAYTLYPYGYNSSVLFARLSGTSMSSPHVAGAAALLRAARPDWTIAETQSALVGSAQPVRAATGSGPASPELQGNGRINVGAALNQAVVFDADPEAFDAYLAGSLAAERLNLPALVQRRCIATCAWERVGRSTLAGAGVFSVAVESDTPDLILHVAPESFSAAPGTTFTLQITADVMALALNGPHAYGHVRIREAGSGAEASLPVVVRSTASDLPEAWSVRGSGFIATQALGARITGATDVRADVHGLFLPTTLSLLLRQDSHNSSAFDDLTDGVAVVPVTISAPIAALIGRIVRTSAMDADLFLAREQNGNSTPQFAEIVAQSTSPSPLEMITLRDPAPGNYYFVVQNWHATRADGDPVAFEWVAIGLQDAGNATARVPDAPGAGLPITVTLAYTEPALMPGGRLYGELLLTASDPLTIGRVLVTVDRDWTRQVVFPIVVDSAGAR